MDVGWNVLHFRARRKEVNNLSGKLKIGHADSISTSQNQMFQLSYFTSYVIKLSVITNYQDSYFALTMQMQKLLWGEPA